MSKIDQIIHVLLLDNDEEDYLIIHEMLAASQEAVFKLAWLRTPTTGGEIAGLICSQDVEVVILDYDPGTLDLTAVSEVIRTKCPTVSLLIISAWQGPDIEMVRRELDAQANLAFLQTSELESHRLIELILSLTLSNGNKMK